MDKQTFADPSATKNVEHQEIRVALLLPLSYYPAPGGAPVHLVSGTIVLVDLADGIGRLEDDYFELPAGSYAIAS